jgi:hypothetical protein
MNAQSAAAEVATSDSGRIDGNGTNFSMATAALNYGERE